MAIAIFPIVLAVTGALIFALSSNSKASTLGLYAFAAGVFALALTLAQHVVRIG